jgi:hypothetical protein
MPFVALAILFNAQTTPRKKQGGFATGVTDTCKRVFLDLCTCFRQSTESGERPANHWLFSMFRWTEQKLSFRIFSPLLYQLSYLSEGTPQGPEGSPLRTCRDRYGTRSVPTTLGENKATGKPSIARIDESEVTTVLGESYRAIMRR